MIAKPRLIPEDAPVPAPKPPLRVIAAEPILDPADPGFAAALDTLARTAWGEARGEGRAGMAAVAAVIVNRVRVAKARGGYWWGDDVVGVCCAPWQFSCWNAADPNRRALMAVTGDNRAFREALSVARAAVAGVLPDPTHGATHYHHRAILPGWARPNRPTAVIGKHWFYRIID